MTQPLVSLPLSDGYKFLSNVGTLCINFSVTEVKKWRIVFMGSMSHLPWNQLVCLNLGTSFKNPLLEEEDKGCKNTVYL
jgi:hypothetical protein